MQPKIASTNPIFKDEFSALKFTNSEKLNHQVKMNLQTINSKAFKLIV